VLTTSAAAVLVNEDVTEDDEKTKARLECSCKLCRAEPLERRKTCFFPCASFWGGKLRACPLRFLPSSMRWGWGGWAWA